MSPLPHKTIGFCRDPEKRIFIENMLSAAEITKICTSKSVELLEVHIRFYIPGFHLQQRTFAELKRRHSDFFFENIAEIINVLISAKLRNLPYTEVCIK